MGLQGSELDDHLPSLLQRVAAALSGVLRPRSRKKALSTATNGASMGIP
jgi:hypothetical protein